MITPINAPAVTSTAEFVVASSAVEVSGPVASDFSASSFEHLQPPKKDLTSIYHFKAAARQFIADGDPYRPSFMARCLERIVGYSTTRRISNFFSALHLGSMFAAQRNYPVLPDDCIVKTSNDKSLIVDGKIQTVAMLAAKFKPKFTTISAAQAGDTALQVSEIRYEVLPPKADGLCYSILYYVGRPRESLPLPIIGKIYDWMRVVLYGTQKDWEPIQVEINRDTGLAHGMLYETSNYTDQASSFDIISMRNLHLLTRIQKQADGSWTHTVTQKNGRTKLTQIADPFVQSRPELVFVSWNGLYDLKAVANRAEMYEIKDASLFFLDGRTFAAEGIDLRAEWLNFRKKDGLVLWMNRAKTSAPAKRLYLSNGEIRQLARTMSRDHLLPQF